MAGTSKIVQYVKEQLSAGYPEAMIRDALIKEGWDHDEVEEALSLARPKPKEPHKEEKPPKKPHEKGHEKPHEKKHAKPQEKPSGRKIGVGFILSIIGGILIVTNSVMDFTGNGDLLSLVVQGVDVSFFGMLDVVLSAFDSLLVNSIIGAFIVVGSIIVYMMPDKAGFTGMFMVALSLITVLVGNGFLIGGIIAILGGILAMAGR